MKRKLKVGVLVVLVLFCAMAFVSAQEANWIVVVKCWDCSYTITKSFGGSSTSATESTMAIAKRAHLKDRNDDHQLYSDCSSSEGYCPAPIYGN